MYLGRVIGTVVATRITPGLEGSKLLLVTPLDHRLARTGNDQVDAASLLAFRRETGPGPASDDRNPVFLHALEPRHEVASLETRH